MNTCDWPPPRFLTRTPHIDTDQQEHNLWCAFVQIARQLDELRELYGTFYRLREELRPAEEGSTERLQAFLRRCKQLIDDYEAFSCNLIAARNSTAWDYANYVADIHYGDQVEAIPPWDDTKLVRFYCCRISIVSEVDEETYQVQPHNLHLLGPTVRKNGSPAKVHYCTVRLFSKDWKLVARANPKWAESLHAWLEEHDESERL